MTNWLNNSFFSIDNAVFIAMNGLAKSAGGFFTPFFVFISFLGKAGIFFIVLGVAMLLLKRTRKMGLAVLLSIAVGAIFTNLTLKPLVARPRPYLSSEEYFDMWKFVGAHKESEFSFPSGHTTVTMTSMTALFLSLNKKYSWMTYLFVVLMGVSRIYLFAHYFTDVIGGVICGGIAGILGYYLAKSLYCLIEKSKEKKFCKWFLEFDVIKLMIKK